jgi:CheY-like chemotaxis protein
MFFKMDKYRPGLNPYFRIVVLIGISHFEKKRRCKSPRSGGNGLPYSERNRKTYMDEKIRILVVDDIKFVREHIQSILKDKYIVDTAASKDDAIKKFQIAAKQNFSYDLILLDNYLPEPDAGLDVLDNIYDNKIDTIVLMLSEHTEPESNPFHTGMKAFSAGAADFIIKPFKREELEDKISSLVAKKKKALAVISMAQSMGHDRFREELEKIYKDPFIDMVTKERVHRMLEGESGSTDSSAFLDQPRDIEISSAAGKSHSSMWEKRIMSLKDIPAEPQVKIFNVLASHRQIYRIKLGSYTPGGTYTEYKLRLKPPVPGEGKLYCTLFGPSPTNCTRQDFALYVDNGYEEKVKSDIEQRLGNLCK